MAGEEEEYDARVAEIIKNFNDSDDGEDSWEAGHFQDVDDLDEQVYGSIEQAGEGFFITALKLFLQTDVAPGKQFHCSPREKDNAPGDVPLMHPIRAIVKVMDAAPDNSIIRMYIYSIDDPYVIDTMVHCAKSKYIRVILHPSQKSIEKIAQFCRNFSRGPDGTSPRHLVETSMEFRAFKLDGERCNEYTSMHEKKIITPDLTVVGSYNLTYQARVWNSESIYCIATTDQDTRRFDEEWASLSERVIRIFNPNPNLLTRVPKKRKGSDVARIVKKKCEGD